MSRDKNKNSISSLHTGVAIVEEYIRDILKNKNIILFAGVSKIRVHKRQELYYY